MDDAEGNRQAAQYRLRNWAASLSCALAARRCAVSVSCGRPLVPPRLQCPSDVHRGAGVSHHVSIRSPPQSVAFSEPTPSRNTVDPSAEFLCLSRHGVGSFFFTLP